MWVYGRPFLEQLFQAAQANGYDVFISPHYYYPTDSSWKVIRGGRSANLCTEAQLHELTESGFEVAAVVRHATAAARHPELGDGYAAALTNFGFLASEVISTDDVLAQINA